MRPVHPYQPRRAAFIIVPIVVVTGVVLLVIVLSIASAVAQGVEETSTTMDSAPDDVDDDGDESEGQAPSINKVIVVSSDTEVAPATVGTSAAEVVDVIVDEPSASLPSTGSDDDRMAAAAAMVFGGSLVLVAAHRGMS